MELRKNIFRRFESLNLPRSQVREPCRARALAEEHAVLDALDGASRGGGGFGDRGRGCGGPTFAGHMGVEHGQPGGHLRTRVEHAATHAAQYLMVITKLMRLAGKTFLAMRNVLLFF